MKCCSSWCHRMELCGPSCFWGSSQSSQSGKFPAPRARKNRPTSQYLMGVSAIFYARVSESANESGNNKPSPNPGHPQEPGFNIPGDVESLPRLKKQLHQNTLCNWMHINMIRDRFGCLNVWPFQPSIYFYGEPAALLVYITIRHGKVAFHSYFSGYWGAKEYLLFTVQPCAWPASTERQRCIRVLALA